MTVASPAEDAPVTKDCAIVEVAGSDLHDVRQFTHQYGRGAVKVGVIEALSTLKLSWCLRLRLDGFASDSSGIPAALASNERERPPFLESLHVRIPSPPPKVAVNRRRKPRTSTAPERSRFSGSSASSN